MGFDLANQVVIDLEQFRNIETVRASDRGSNRASVGQRVFGQPA
jgi:hypothetical protein